METVITNYYLRVNVTLIPSIDNDEEITYNTYSDAEYNMDLTTRKLLHYEIENYLHNKFPSLKHQTGVIDFNDGEKISYPYIVIDDLGERAEFILWSMPEVVIPIDIKVG